MGAAGQTPQLYQRGRHRQKVSLAITFWVTPHYRRLGLYYETLEDTYFNKERVAVFIEQLMRVLANRMSGSRRAISPALDAGDSPSRRPMLDPVAPIFSRLKYSRLCNFAPANAHELNDAIVRELDNVVNDQQRLRNFWHASELPLPGS